MTVVVDLFSAAQLAALEALVDERVAAAFAQGDREQKRWLSSTEAAAYLGTTRRALYRRVERGRIPVDAVRHQGRSLLFDREALDAWLEEQP